MGWDKGGRYYTRSKRVNGKVVREHIGGGEAGRLAAQQDALEREKRQAERAAANAQRAKLAVLYAQMDELNELVDLLFRAYLMALGYRQHNRGEWRKRRVRRQEAPVQPCDAAQSERPAADRVEAITQEQPHGPVGTIPTPVTLRMMFLTKPKIAVADAPDRFPLQQNGDRRRHLRTGRGQADIVHYEAGSRRTARQIRCHQRENDEDAFSRGRSRASPKMIGDDRHRSSWVTRETTSMHASVA